jgi:hypothetical protein
MLSAIWNDSPREGLPNRAKSITLQLMKEVTRDQQRRERLQRADEDYRSETGQQETEVFAYGPKGGETRRFIGWFSAIGNALFYNKCEQLYFAF